MGAFERENNTQAASASTRVTAQAIADVVAISHLMMAGTIAIATLANISTTKPVFLLVFEIVTKALGSSASVVAVDKR